jgi:peptide/nickel transport system substrate-binding protein
MIRLLAGVVAVLAVFAAMCRDREGPRVALLRVVVGTAPGTMDPWRVVTTLEASIIDHVAETLVAIDSAGAVVPKLADSWTIDDDPHALNLHVRRGVRFHDGGLLSPEAVKWNLDRLTGTNMHAFGRVPDPYDQIAAVTVDGEQVRIALRTAAAHRLLAELSTTHTAILSPGSIDSLGNTFEHVVHPVGSGPFAFAGLAARRNVRLTRFAGYWGRKATVDSLDFWFEPRDSVRTAIVGTGFAHAAVLPDLREATRLADVGRHALVLTPTTRIIYFGLSTRRPPLNDARVRRALHHAVDTRTIMTRLLGDAADPLDGLIAPGTEAWCPVVPYEYDVARAQRLLREAGVRAGTRLELIAPRGRYLRDADVPDAVAGYLRAVGFDVSVRVVDDWTSYLAAIGETAGPGVPQAHLFGWAPAVPTAAAALEVFSSALWPPFGPATTFYANASVDSLIGRARTDADSAQRAAAACAGATAIWNDAPALFLWRQRFPVVHAPGLMGFTVLPNEKIVATYVTQGR